MPVVAIEQEMGARGAEIAERVSRALGLVRGDSDVAQRVLERWPIPPSALDISELRRPTLLERLRAVDVDVDIFTAAEVLEAAARGNAILLRWHAAHLLCGMPNAVRVRVGAPFEQRARAVSEDLEIAETEARTIVMESDRAREASCWRRFGRTLDDPLAYDLCLDSAQMQIDEAAEHIVARARSAQRQDIGEARQRLRDRHLEMLAAATLRACPDTRWSCVGARVCADGLYVTGVARTKAEQSRILAALQYLDPHRPVRSELRCASDYRTRTSSI